MWRPVLLAVLLSQPVSVSVPGEEGLFIKAPGIVTICESANIGFTLVAAWEI